MSLKRILLGLVFIGFKISLIGQGLNVELGFNNQIGQTASQVLNYGGYTYFTRYEIPILSTTNKHILAKHDTSGMLLWEKEYEINAEIIGYGGMLRTQTLHMHADSSGIYVLTYSLPDCDVMLPTAIIIEKYSHEGLQLWMYSDVYESNEILPFSLDSVSAFSLGLDNRLNIGLTTNSGIEILSLHKFDGAFISSVIANLEEINSLVGLENDAFLVVENDKLKQVDTSGNVLFENTFNNPLKYLSVHNNQFYFISGDSIVVLDSSFSNTVYTTLPNSHSPQKIKIINDQIFISASDGSNTFIYSMQSTSEFQLLHSIPHSVNLNDFLSISFDHLYDFDQYHVTFVEPYALTEFSSIRYLDYSFNNNEQFERFGTDAGIVDIEIINTRVTYFEETFVMSIWVDAKVCVQNFGDNPIQRIRINDFHSASVWCYFNAYSEEFLDLNILPGDTAWIFCSNLYTSSSFYSTSSNGNPLNREICAYTSHPNNIVDLNVSNDEGCKNQFLGFLSLINPNDIEKSRKILKIVDILGREARPSQGKLLFYVYDDGHVQKIIHTE